MFTEEFAPILCSLSQKIAKEGILPNLFNEAAITLIPKLDKQSKERKLQDNIIHGYTISCKDP